MHVLSIIIQPLVVFGLFLGAAFLGRFILNRLPPGRLRSILSYRMPLHPETEAERRDWKPVLVVWLVIIPLYIWIWWLGLGTY